jgi:pimeloyl-ACP methyl ester carboxylesterase
MAEDAAAVLDAADIAKAHVVGVSMGGMIAQEFTLQFPQRVDSLILGCSAPGGRNAQRAEPAAIAMLQETSTMTVERAAQAAVPFIYAPGTPRHLIDEDIAIRRPWFPRREGYLAQLQAILAWESYSRLPQITAPTLVLHGKGDRLIPAENGRILAERIPGAKLALLERAGHIFSTDQTEAAHKAILEFL